jgi:predicted enzyme related to lactoylglutathione lyase
MIRDITHVTMLVDDQDDALAFYRDTLGFAVRDDVSTPEGGRWVTVSPAESEHPQLTLVVADTEAKRERVGSQVADHVAIVLSTDDCRATYETLRDRGVEFAYEPEEQPWGVETTFEDPYGNVFDLLEYRPMA